MHFMDFIAVKKSIKRSGVVVYSYVKGQCLQGYKYPTIGI